jgi:hypothetical protein
VHPKKQIYIPLDSEDTKMGGPPINEDQRTADGTASWDRASRIDLAGRFKRRQVTAFRDAVMRIFRNRRNRNPT